MYQKVRPLPAFLFETFCGLFRSKKIQVNWRIYIIPSYGRRREVTDLAGIGRSPGPGASEATFTGMTKLLSTALDNPSRLIGILHLDTYLTCKSRPAGFDQHNLGLLRSLNMENGSSSEGKDPSAFLTEIIGAPITVKLNSGVVYKGTNFPHANCLCEC